MGYVLVMSMLASAVACDCLLACTVGLCIVQGYMERVRNQKRWMNASDIATILYSLAYLQAPPPAQGLDQLLSELERMYDTAAGDDLANVAMALAQFRYSPRSGASKRQSHASCNVCGGCMSH